MEFTELRNLKIMGKAVLQKNRIENYGVLNYKKLT